MKRTQQDIPVRLCSDGYARASAAAQTFGFSRARMIREALIIAEPVWATGHAKLHATDYKWTPPEPKAVEEKPAEAKAA